MSAFDRLNPLLAHHIVNSLGWRDLRPLQEQSIGPVLAGRDALLLAPTAGGKTEAAVFPLFSRMLTERWDPLSIIYICPIKALLNNLETRLASYARLIGRRVGIWHGDIGESARNRIRREPPDLLLITPESLEVLLVSRRLDHRVFFADVRAVVVDEIHAFAGDDRGWHLLSLLARITDLCRTRPQRLGLSATVGNPRALLDWLGEGGEGVVLDPGPGSAAETDVRLDHVGSLEHAAHVISRLHAGEKRLVFCDSRARSEQLANALRLREVTTHISHAGLSADERARAETAFAEGRDCVIVATSTLELGVDVGDLDRVIQLDAPFTVASFLQRIGRTGRRPGTSRNCLFLTTGEDAFLRAAALLHLWQDGYVEDIVPPPLPFHLLAQQLMALTLQEGGVGSQGWFQSIARVAGFADMSPGDRRAVVDYMLARGLLFSDGGLLSVGLEGERAYGYRHFMELFSIFISPPFFTVLHGRREIGQVHHSSFGSVDPDRSEPMVLALAGRTWRVTALDWRARTAMVEPTEQPGRYVWLGSARPLHPVLARAITTVLREGLPDALLTRRGREEMESARARFEGIAPSSIVKKDDAVTRWWTFAGGLFNRAVAAVLAEQGLETGSDELSVWFEGHASLETISAAIEALLTEDGPLVPPMNKAELEALKFRECVPEHLIEAQWAARWDQAEVRRSLRRGPCL